jgi:hypothetical protein
MLLQFLRQTEEIQFSGHSQQSVVVMVEAVTSDIHQTTVTATVVDQEAVHQDILMVTQDAMVQELRVKALQEAPALGNIIPVEVEVLLIMDPMVEHQTVDQVY